MKPDINMKIGKCVMYSGLIALAIVVGISIGKYKPLHEPLHEPIVNHLTNTFMAHKIMVKRGVDSNDPNDHMFRFLSSEGIIWHASWIKTDLTEDDVEELNQKDE